MASGGKDTHEYRSVLSRLNSITKSLEVNQPAKDSLTQKFQEHEWLDIVAKPTEEQLVKLALIRIENDVKQYAEFITMLEHTTGMNIMVDQLKDMQATALSGASVGTAVLATSQKQTTPPQRPTDQTTAMKTIDFCDLASGPPVNKAAPKDSAVAKRCDINALRKSFKSLKSAVQKGVEKSKEGGKSMEGVTHLIEEIMNLPAPLRDECDDDYLNKRTDDIYASKSIPVVFSRIGLHWDYLNPDVYEHLIETYNLEDLNEMLDGYRSELDRFIDCITLQDFCKLEGKKCTLKPPPGFEDHVTKHDWESTTPLRKVIEFRVECTNQYGLRKCAVWLVGMGKGCVCIALLVPKGKVEFASVEFYEKHSILRLKLNGVCIYNKGGKYIEEEDMSPMTTLCGAAIETATEVASENSPEEHVTFPIDDYKFVTEPEDYFFCPVNYDLLLQPQQSSCCGNHFSPEAVTVFQGNECPLCKKKNFTAQPNKYFSDRVHSLDVFCQHKEKGCEWKGKLSELQHHMETCPLRNTPSETPPMVAVGEGGRVKNIQNDAELEEALKEAGEKLVVVDFFAPWCEPSTRFAPDYEQLSVKYSSAIFLKVDLALCWSSAEKFFVLDTPTFLFFKNQEMIIQVMDANKELLESTIIQYLDDDESELETVEVSSVSGARYAVATEEGGRVKTIPSDFKFQRELKAAGEKLVVVDFCTTWCMPSVIIAPDFERLSIKYSSVVFIKVDCDICKETSDKYEVNVVPTFMFFKKREVIHRVEGANIPQLEDGIIQHLATVLKQAPAQPSPSRASASSTGEQTTSTSYDEKPDLRTVDMIRYKHDSEIKEYRLIDVIATEWQAIGRELGIEDSRLMNIRSSHPLNPNAAANDMLRVWMGRDVEVTWAKLIQAMKAKEELTAVATEFEYALLHRIMAD